MWNYSGISLLYIQESSLTLAGDVISEPGRYWHNLYKVETKQQNAEYSTGLWAWSMIYRKKPFDSTH